MNPCLWVIQVVLALLFLFAAVMKFVIPMDQMIKQVPLSAGFIYFIAVSEILGALGLILPRWLGIKRWLTPLAAAGLFVIMVGAVVITVQTQPAVMAVLPAFTGILCAVVAFGRWRVVP
jgi:uncharacterized membrane protein